MMYWHPILGELWYCKFFYTGLRIWHDKPAGQRAVLTYIGRKNNGKEETPIKRSPWTKSKLCHPQYSFTSESVLKYLCVVSGYDFPVNDKTHLFAVVLKLNSAVSCFPRSSSSDIIVPQT